MCYGCYQSPHSSGAWTGDIHLCTIDDNMFLCHGSEMVDKTTFHSLDSNTHITLTGAGNLHSFLDNAGDSKTYPVSKEVAYWVARAAFDNSFEELDRVFKITGEN